MTSFKVRKYRDEDEELVKEIFALGMSEHVPTSFMHMLKQPLTQMVLMCVFCALLTSSKSFLLPVLAVTLLLAGARQLVSYLFTSYIDASLKDDLKCIRETLASIFFVLLASSGSLLLSILGLILVLLASREGVRFLFGQGIQLGLNEDLQDIRKSYMQGDRSCFWVAEVQGMIGGTVGILPAKDEPGCWELKRISVRKEYRGQGMAKVLCKTALDFVINQGVEDVVLYTSMVQTDAHQLYKSVGFQMVETFVWPSLPAKLINFMVLKYRYRVLV